MGHTALTRCLIKWDELISVYRNSAICTYSMLSRGTDCGKPETNLSRRLLTSSQ